MKLKHPEIDYVLQSSPQESRGKKEDRRVSEFDDESESS
jgi:hypothetical protein